VLIIAIMLNIQGAEAIEVLAGTQFQSRAGGGYLEFSDDFNCTGWAWVDDVIIFTDFNNSDGVFGDVGFDLPDGMNATLTEITTDNIIQSVTAWSETAYRVYAPDQGVPTNVVGGDGWIWGGASMIATIDIDITEAVTISWADYWYVENDTYSEPVSTLPDLINQYLPTGDISGFIISPYTMTMGVMFFPIVFLMFIMPAYQRLGLMITGVLVIIFWTTLEVALTPQAINVVNILIRIGLAGVLVYLFFARRGQSG
jgi:hypothetical protein